MPFDKAVDVLLTVFMGRIEYVNFVVYGKVILFLFEKWHVPNCRDGSFQ